MKKSGWIAILVIVIAAASMYLLKQAATHHSKAFELAQTLKKEGLPVENIRVNRSDIMYEEVSATGKNLVIKISVYGNGLFLKNIINNLKNDRKNGTKTEPQPIYTAGPFIVVVYTEPAKGLIKSALLKQFQDVEEY